MIHNSIITVAAHAAKTAPSDNIWENGAGAVFLIYGSIIIVGYMLPWIIGKMRGLHNSGTLFVLNLVLGWTVLIWFSCLIWGMVGQTKDQRAFYRRMAKEAK